MYDDKNDVFEEENDDEELDADLVLSFEKVRERVRGKEGARDSVFTYLRSNRLRNNIEMIHDKNIESGNCGSIVNCVGSKLAQP